MSSHESNIQLARLWVALSNIRKRIDNEVIPLSIHLGLEDPELMQSLETLSERIEQHFERRHLVIEPRTDQPGI